VSGDEVRSASAVKSRVVRHAVDIKIPQHEAQGQSRFPSPPEWHELTLDVVAAEKSDVRQSSGPP
jgi:hypothetical protein